LTRERSRKQKKEGKGGEPPAKSDKEEPLKVVMKRFGAFKLSKLAEEQRKGKIHQGTTFLFASPGGGALSFGGEARKKRKKFAQQSPE